MRLYNNCVSIFREGKMDKKWKEFAAANGLACEKNQCYGTLYGYQVSITMEVNSGLVYRVGVHANCGAHAKEVYDFLAVENKKKYKLRQVTAEDCGIYFVTTRLIGIVKHIDTLLRELAEYLKSLGVDGTACPYCGQEMTKSVLAQDNGGCFRAHEECLEQRLQSAVTVENMEAALPNNYWNGFAGALVGGLVGCAIFAILFMIGYVAFISSFLGAIAASFLYSRFGGKNNAVKIVIVSAVTFVMIIITFFVCYFVQVSVIMNEAGISGSPVAVFFQLLAEDADVQKEVWYNFALTVVFTGVGIAYNIVSLVRQQKKVSSQIKRVGQ